MTETIETKNLESESTESFNLRLQKLEKILASLEVDAPEARSHLQRWRQSLTSLAGLRSSFSLPITCIGPVKSGKSTLINTLAGADLLPTGAGITTSFPTTVRAAKKFSAHIQLQPENIIEEIFNRACNLLFSDDLSDQQLSLFKTEDRLHMEELLNKYQSSIRLTRHGIFNESYRLLRNLINGAQTVMKHYHNSELDFSIKDPDDQRYRHFIRNESLSPYLLGIEIMAPLKLLPPYLALRDLPGLDTPNPSHQSIIVQQLSESPALIYVISSRIGLRQADYQLLEHLRELGIEERLLFVINLDLDEHHCRNELEIMIKRCTNELRELGFNQSFYAFSALALFWSRAETFSRLNSTCQQRFKRWQVEAEKLSLSVAGADLFLKHLQDLGNNRATSALLKHSEQRLQQIIGNCQRLIKARLTSLSGEDKKLNSEHHLKQENCLKVDSVHKESERIITGICTDIEKSCYTEITNWLNRKDDASLFKYLHQLIESYTPPLELVPEKSRNPLTPVRIIDNHFQLTIPGQLRERVAIETLKFMDGLHLRINKRLLSGCAPLFIICENFISDEGNLEEELPLPIKISGEIPEFTMTTIAEERFAFIDKIRDIITLWSKKLIHLKEHRPLGEEYGLQMKKATLKELPRWLGNYREQLKYAYLHHHLKECHTLINTFFSDLLVSAEVTLEESVQFADNSRLTTAQKSEKLKTSETLLEELKNS